MQAAELCFVKLKLLLLAIETNSEEGNGKKSLFISNNNLYFLVKKLNEIIDITLISSKKNMQN